MAAPRNLGLRMLGVNAGRTLVTNIATILLGLGLSILLARGLGTEANGVYALALLLPTMLATLMNLGLGPANVYHIGRGDLTPRQALFASLYAWTLLTAVGVIVTPLVLAWKGAEWFPGVPNAVLFMAVISFPMTLLQGYFASLLQGVQDFKRFNRLTIVTPFVTLVLSAILILGFRTGVMGAVVAYTVGQAISLGLAWYVLAPHVRPVGDRARLSFLETLGYLRTSISYGWKAHLSNMIAFINYRTDVYLVNLFMSPAYTGVYWVAIQMAERMWIIANVVSTVLIPRLSQLHTEEEKRLAITPIVTRFVLGTTILACLLLALISKPFIYLLFGEAFAGARMALLLLLPGVLAGSVMKVISNDFAARGKPEINSAVSAVTVVVNIVANVLLIPRYGINGGAIAATISYVISLAMKLAIYPRFSHRPWYELLVPTKDDVALVREGTALVLGKIKSLAAARRDRRGA